MEDKYDTQKKTEEYDIQALTSVNGLTLLLWETQD